MHNTLSVHVILFLRDSDMDVKSQDHSLKATDHPLKTLSTVTKATTAPAEKGSDSPALPVCPEQPPALGQAINLYT